MGLYGFVVYDSIGKCLVHYFKKSLISPDLVSGLLSAMQSFSKELLGSEPKIVRLNNGVSMRYEDFNIEIIEDVNISYCSSLKGKKLVELNGNYVTLDSLSDDLKLKLAPKALTLDELICALKNNEKSYYGDSFKFHFEKRYVPTNRPGDLRVNYAIIYDAVDENIEMLDGEPFINWFLKRLGALLKKKAQYLGKAVELGETNGLEDKFAEDFSLLAKFYENCRKYLISKNLVKLPLNLPNPNLCGLNDALSLLPLELFKTASLWYAKYCKDFTISYDDFLQKFIDVFNSMKEVKKDYAKELHILKKAVESVECDLSMPVKKRSSEEYLKALKMLKKALKLFKEPQRQKSVSEFDYIA